MHALRKAQETTGNALIRTPEQIPEIKPTPMASNMLGPLLEAYQETILEKESALEKSNNELASYAQQCQSVKQESKELKRKLEYIQVLFLIKAYFEMLLLCCTSLQLIFYSLS